MEENPIRKGIEIIKQKFFSDNFFCVKVNNFTKNNEEYFISLTFDNSLHNVDVKFVENEIKSLLNYNEDEKNEEDKDRGKIIHIDFYINDLKNIWNLIDYKYTFFSSNITYENLMNDFKLNIPEEEYIFKNNIYVYLIISDFWGRNFIYSLGFESDNTNAINFFKFCLQRGYNYLIT